MPQIDWTGAGCAAICIAIKCILSPGRVYRVETASGNPPAVAQVDHMAKLAGHQQPLHDLRMPRQTSAGGSADMAGTRTCSSASNESHFLGCNLNRVELQFERATSASLRTKESHTWPLHMLSGHASQPCACAWYGLTRSAPPSNAAGFVCTAQKQSCGPEETLMVVGVI